MPSPVFLHLNDYKSLAMLKQPLHCDMQYRDWYKVTHTSSYIEAYTKNFIIFCPLKNILKFYVFHSVTCRVFVAFTVYCDYNNYQRNFSTVELQLSGLILNLLTTTIVTPPSNASKRQMGFNSAFKGLIGTEKQPDKKKIRIIGFLFENRLHWQFEVGEKISANGYFSLHIYLHTNKT